MDGDEKAVGQSGGDGFFLKYHGFEEVVSSAELVVVAG